MTADAGGAGAGVAWAGAGEPAGTEILEALGEPAWAVDLLGRFVYASPAAAALLGLAPALVPGRELARACAASSALVVSRFLAELSARGELPAGELELELLREDGTTVWTQTRLGVLRGPDGRVRGLAGCSRDVTARRHDEGLLETRLVALEAAASGVLITDPQGVIEYVNAALCAMTGYRPEELRGRTPAIFKSGMHSADFYRLLWDTIRVGDIWRGEMINRRRDGSLYTEEQSIAPVLDGDGRVMRYVSIKQDVTRRKELEKQLESMAFSDQLTGLPNRPLFFDRLTRAIELGKRTGSYFALFYLDLDGFKEVNDRMGHKAGDQLLVEVARRLCLSVRTSDTVARMGGDEFTVLLFNLGSEQQAATLADKILRSLSAEYSLPAGPCRIGSSIGISLFPDDGDDAETLLARADSALYAAKRGGKGRVVRFDSKDALVLGLRDTDFRLPERGELVIGRGPSCDIRIGDALASSEHARIRIGADGAWIEDLGSRNGVVVDGRRIDRPCRLEVDSRFVLGQSTFVVRRSGARIAPPTGETDATATQDLRKVIRTLVPPSAD